MKEIIKQILTGPNGTYSSKRIITLCSFLLLSLGFISNILFDIPLKEYIWDGMLLFTGSGLGFTTLDHYGKK